MSLFVLYFGTNRRYNHMAHHEILMGPRYREWMVDLFDLRFAAALRYRKHLASDFSLYLLSPYCN